MNPHTILLTNVLPLYAEDAQEMVVRVIQQVKEQGGEIELEEGFDLYKQLTAIRRLFTNALPEYGSHHHFYFVQHANKDTVSPSHFMLKTY